MPGTFWRTSAQDLLHVLDTRLEGLSDDEAATQLKPHGPNAIASHPS
jgi:Cation transporter/ATPase, N-terminus